MSKRKTRRIAEMEQFIYKHKNVSMDTLCEVFAVSMNTIRRDLRDIINRTNIKKTYGGVAVYQEKHLTEFIARSTENQCAKKKIAERAASFVQDGDVIFIDSGTTTALMLPFLSERRNLTILTNNLDFIVNAMPYPDLNIITLSGTLDRNTLSFTGESATVVLEQYNITKAFMAASGISTTYGITHSLPSESYIKKAAVARSRKIFLLVDHAKFNAVSLSTYCALDVPDVIITDMAPPNEYPAIIEHLGHRLIIAD